jgi:hypothetical protein
MNAARSFFTSAKTQILGFLMSIALLCSIVTQAQVRAVWALGDGEKVFRNDLRHPSKMGNYTWDGKQIHMRGMYNEVLAFQVIVETDSLGAKGIEVSIDLPVNQASGKSIAGNTLKYGPSGTVEIFTEHYLQVVDSTYPNWFYGSPASRPKKMKGWIPDALIPVDAIPGRGGFPFDIGPSRNQGFWVDVHLPREPKNHPAGSYLGKVRITQKGSTIREIPLLIDLLPTYLSDENVSTVWLFTSDAYAYYPGLSHQQVDEMLKYEGHRHRVDVVGGFNVNDMPFNSDSMNLYKSYLDGTAYTPAMGYHGPGEGQPEKIFPVGMYGSPALGTTRQEVQKQSDLWVDWFSANAPAVKYFWYITDEPPVSRYPWIKERAEWIKTNPGSGKKLPVFTTQSYKHDLSGAIDIWAGFDGVELNNLSEARKTGGDYWFYNGNRPRYGSVILEGAAVDFRVNSWILYKYGINCWFIWHGTQWQHNGQGPKRHLHQNVFANPLTFINSDMDFGNGDGIVFYPGHMPFYPQEDRGLNTVLPSIRLKNIRRGQQDAVIMKMAEKKLGREKVIELISTIVPRALSEVDMTEPVPWSEQGDAYDQVRDKLLNLLQ